MKIWVTLFDDVYARDLTGREMELEELAELVRTTTAPTKARLPLLKFAARRNVPLSKPRPL